MIDSGPNSSWQLAEDIAQSRGGHLVTVNNSIEEQWLENFYTGGIDRFYIGYNDVAQEGTWVWSSGESSLYTNWTTGAPDNATPPSWGEDYAEMVYRSPNIWWNDIDPSRQPDIHTDGIAEYTSYPIPEPSTMFLLGAGIPSLFKRSRLNRTTPHITP